MSVTGINVNYGDTLSFRVADTLPASVHKGVVGEKNREQLR